MDIEMLIFIIVVFLMLFIILTMIVGFVKDKRTNMRDKIIIGIVLVLMSTVFVVLQTYYESKGYNGLFEAKHKVGALIFYIGFPIAIVANIVFKIRMNRFNKRQERYLDNKQNDESNKLQ